MREERVEWEEEERKGVDRRWEGCGQGKGGGPEGGKGRGGKDSKVERSGTMVVVAPTRGVGRQTRSQRVCGRHCLAGLTVPANRRACERVCFDAG